MHHPIVLKYLPNALSLSRVVMSLSLLFITPMSPVFIAIYITAFVTDCIDGTIARRLGVCSTLGKNLDSLGDLLLVGVVLIVVMPWMELSPNILLWIGLIALSRLATTLWMKKRSDHIIMTHSIPNKIVNFLVFMLPFVFLWFGTVGVAVCCIYGTYDAVYEWYKASDAMKPYTEDVGNPTE